MIKRTKRERRRGRSDAFDETLSHQFSDRQCTEFHHTTIASRKPKGILEQLPANMPRELRRQLSRSIAKLERLAREGKDPPGILVDYIDAEGCISTFRYIPAPQAERMAEDLITAAMLLQAREEARAC